MTTGGEGTSTPPPPQSTQKKIYDELLDIDIVVQENEIPYYEEAVSSAQSGAALYTGETLTIASVLICLFSTVIGFAVGFLVSRKIAKGDYNSCGHHYLETQRNLNKYVTCRACIQSSSNFKSEVKFDFVDLVVMCEFISLGKVIPSITTTNLATLLHHATTPS